MQVLLELDAYCCENCVGMDVNNAERQLVSLRKRILTPGSLMTKEENTFVKVNLCPEKWREFFLCESSKLNCRVCLGEGGQSFTWETLDPVTWYNVISGYCVIIRLDEEAGSVNLYLPVDCTDTEAAKAAVIDYLRLNVDLEELCVEWSKSDPKFPQNYQGIRLLRQDPLETLFAFICSQNNLISRIKQLVRTLKREYGPLKGTFEIDGKEVEFYGFPEEVSVFLDSEAQLREWKFGYRAKYISSAASFLINEHQIARSSDLSKYRTSSYEDCVRFLREIPGIGPKVADCVALMSLDQLGSVPIDTHIWRIARERYKFALSKTVSVSLNDRLYKEIGDKFRQLFGDKAGWAHSVLFTAELRPFKK